jgi:hypothetical protein
VSCLASQISDLGLIWRETSNSDVGIDGQIEFVDSADNATGMIVAVQIKSGSSYLRGNDDIITYYPSAKHANYWREFPVPVLLMIHDPTTRSIYWTDARLQLRSSLGSVNAIQVPRANVVAESRPEDFFATLRPIEQPRSEQDVVRALIEHSNLSPGFRMSFFELFGFGITDIGRKLFFSTALCMEIAEYRAGLAGIGWSVGSEEHNFIDRYISFLVAQGLIYYDYSDYLLDRDVRALVPTFLVPLTERGRITLKIMQSVSGSLFNETLLAIDDESARSILRRLSKAEQIQQKVSAPGFDFLRDA